MNKRLLAVILTLALVPYAHPAEQTMRYNTLSHAVSTPIPGGTAAPDYDFRTLVPYTGLPEIGPQIANKDYVDLIAGNNHISKLLSGGGVAWTGVGLNYIVSAATYLINGVLYQSPQTAITLATADPSNDRIDVFAVNTSSAAVKITGTPGGPPLEPQVDPVTQLRLTSAYVPAGSTTPTVTNANLYLENTEWTSSTNSAGTITLASTNNPYAGTKCIEGTSTVAGNYFTLVKPAAGTEVLTNYANLVLQLRSKATWPKQKSLSVFWLSGSSTVGSAVAIQDGVFGFTSTNTSSYQQIVIPVERFNTGSSTVTSLRVAVAGSGAAIGWYIDNVILQTGGAGGGGTGDFSTNVNVAVSGDFVQFTGTTGKLGTDGGLSRSTDGTFAANSDLLLPSQKAIKTYVAGLVGGGVTPAALTRSNDTNVTLTLGGTPATALLQATSLTLGWTGTLAVGRGGTGVSSLGDITKSNDTNVTLTLGGTPTGAVINSTSFTLGWTGTLGISRGGFGKAMTDPNADRLIAWDDTDGDFQYVTVGTGLTYTHSSHTLSASATAQTHAVVMVCDGSGSVLSTGTKAYTKIPFGGTLTGWLVIASPSGSVTVDILRAADGAGLPVTSIVGGSGTKPSVSSAVENSSTSFTNWTSTTLTAKDNMAISLSGVSTSTYVAVTLYYQ